jgi:hypothetical protein
LEDLLRRFASCLYMEAQSAAEAVSEISTMVSRDPYLDYQPAFAYALPIQLFVGGITLTLLAVLLMHLLCTFIIAVERLPS